MPFLVCEKCGGYYQLQKGESIDDFESCLCGGKLTYTENNPEKTIKENYEDYEGEERSTDENGNTTGKMGEAIKLICPNCLNEDQDGLYCSNCGGKLLKMKNGEVISKRKNEDYSLTKKVQEKNSPKNLHSEPINGLKSLFNRIKWVGVSAGVIFIVIIILIIFYSLMSIMSFNYYYSDDISYNDFQFFVNVSIISLLLIGFSSGAMASYINKHNDFIDGLLNGFMVGFIGSVILGVYSSFTYSVIGGFLIIIIGIPVLASLSSVGGIIGIFVRNKLEDF
jgi:hypothetical protein